MMEVAEPIRSHHVSTHMEKIPAGEATKEDSKEEPVEPVQYAQVSDNLIGSTLSAIQEEAELYSSQLVHNLSCVGPWMSEKFELFQYRVSLGLPIDLGTIRPALIDGFAWGTLCSIGMGLGQILGHSSICSSVLGAVFTKLMAMFLAEFFIPLFFYWSLQNKTPDNGKFHVLLLSCLMGILTGFSLADKPMNLYSIPPGFLQSLVMGFITAKFPDPNPNRSTYLVALIGSVAAFSISSAIAMDQMTSSVFISLLIGLAVTISNVQISLAAARDNDPGEGLIVLMIGVVSAQTLDIVFIHLLGEAGSHAQGPREEL